MTGMRSMVRGTLAAVVLAVVLGIGAATGSPVPLADGGGTGQTPPPPPPPPTTDSHGWVG